MIGVDVESCIFWVGVLGIAIAVSVEIAAGLAGVQPASNEMQINHGMRRLGVIFSNTSINSFSPGDARTELTPNIKIMFPLSR